VAALMAVCPATAALILVHRDRWARRREGPAEESFRLPPDQGEGLVRARPAFDARSDGVVVRRVAMERHPGPEAALVTWRFGRRE